MDWKTLPLLEVKGRGIGKHCKILSLIEVKGRGIGKHCKILSLIEVKIEGSKTLQNIVVDRGED